MVALTYAGRSVGKQGMDKRVRQRGCQVSLLTQWLQCITQVSPLCHNLTKVSPSAQVIQWFSRGKLRIAIQTSYNFESF
jgi:hypothetical protein